MNGYISMRGWAKHQHYKDRNPPWIKVHKELLHDYAFSCLQSASKAHVMLMWVLASQMDNKLPNDAKWIASRIGCDGDKVNINELILHGFIRCDSEALASCKQSAMPETETEAYKEETDNWSNDFDLFWSEYPKKVGKKPCKAIWKRVRPNAAELIANIQERLARDRAWKAGYIENPQTYLNQERWTDEIQADKPAVEKIPRNDSALEGFAIANGLHEKGKAPQTIQNNYQYRQWIEARLKEQA